MRIAVLTSLFPVPARPREGIFAERRWLGMTARGHRVDVVHPLPWTPPRPVDALLGAERAGLGRAPRLERRGPLVVHRPRYAHWPGRPLANARAFARAGARAVARLDPAPELAVCDYAWPAAAAVGRLRARGLPVVVHGRGSDVLAVREDPRLGPVLAEGLRDAGHWGAVSRDLVAAMDALAGHPGGGRLTPNGVDTDLFRPGGRAAARRALGLDPRAPRVLVVGHLIERKRPLLALEAFAGGAPADACLDLVGRGPLEGALEAEIERRGLGRRVRLIGEADADELALRYRAADLLVLASAREGRPNVVLEALASGLPVVATAAGGTPELLEGLPGALVPVDDGPALTAAVAAFLARPPAPEDCRAQVAAYTWPAALDALEGLLREALEADGPPSADR